MANPLVSALQSQLNQKSVLPVPNMSQANTKGNPGFISSPVSTANSSNASMYTPPQAGSGAIPTSRPMSNQFGSPTSGLVGSINNATGLAPTPKPQASTPLKSVTSPDGTKTEYHAPTPSLGGSTTSVDPNINPVTGQKYVTGNAQTGYSATNDNGTTTQVPANTTPSTGTQPYNPLPNPNPQTDPTFTQTKALTGVQNSAQDNAQIQYYQDQAVKMSNAQSYGQIAPYGEAGAYNAETGVLPDLTRPDLAGRAPGTQALYSNLAGIGGLSAQTGLNNALTARGQQIGASEYVAGALSPQMQAGMLTNPTTGQPLNPNLVATAVSQANQLINNGASPNDPTVQALINPFGFYGTSALVNAQNAISGGGYNPTGQSAVASSNASQGVDYKQQAVNLDTALKQLAPVSDLADNFLNSNNLINSTNNPNINLPLNKYIASVQNPSAVTQYNAILGDIKKFTSQILSSNNGTIPTDVTSTLSSFDPSNLTATQLKPYLALLDELGNNQKSVVQGQANKLLGAQGNNYTGTPSDINTTPPPTLSNTYLQALAGTGMNVANGVSGTVNAILNYISKTI